MAGGPVIKVKTSVRGVKTIAQQLDLSDRKMRDALTAAIYQQGMKLLRKSLRRVPVDTGRLRSTGFAAPPKNRRRPRCEVGYGTDYAEAVHEMTGMVDWNAGGTGAKYLEIPYKELMAGHKQALVRLSRKNFENKIGIKAIPKKLAQTPTEHEEKIAKKAKIKAKAKASKARKKARRKAVKQAKRTVTRTVKKAKKTARRTVKKIRSKAKRTAKRTTRRIGTTVKKTKRRLGIKLKR